MRLVAFIAAVFVAAFVFAADSQSASAETLHKTKGESKVVIIEPGDSLSKIAKNNDTTYQRLYNANTEVKHPDVIYAEDKLRIPGPDEKLTKRPLPKDAKVPAPQPKPVVRQQSKAPVVRQSYNQPAAVAAPKPTGGVWDRLAACESGGNWSINSGNGYYGGLQFTLSTWRSVGGSGYPHQASRAEQIKRGQILQARSGWGQWPACTAMLGLR